MFKSRKIPSVKDPYLTATAKALLGLFAEIKTSASRATSSKLSKISISRELAKSLVFSDLPSSEVITSMPFESMILDKL